MKPNVTTYVDPHQKEAALDVIHNRSIELGSQVIQVPPLSSHNWSVPGPPTPGLQGEVQTHNASLAVALASHFLHVHNNPDHLHCPPVVHQPGQLLPELSPLHLSQSVSRGLEKTRWPGRNQVVRRRGVEYYLDGAHTEESMLVCADWFRNACIVEDKVKVFRVLLFNTTGDRDVRTLLDPLTKLDLDLVIFCTNLSRHKDSVDQQNFTTNEQMQLDKCDLHLSSWSELQSDLPDRTPVPGVVIPCINDALLWATAGRDTDLPPPYQITHHPTPPSLIQSDMVQLLVTGSLHLVGGVVGCIR